jgi:hypothetical protein
VLGDDPGPGGSLGARAPPYVQPGRQVLGNVQVRDSIRRWTRLTWRAQLG